MGVDEMPPSATPSLPARGFVRNENSEDILDAAAALFYAKGYYATSMRELAARVGMKAGSLYNHYESKQEILLRIAEGTMRDLLAGAEEALADAKTPEQKLRAFVRAHVVFHAHHRLRAKVGDDQLFALDPPNREQVQSVRDTYQALLRSILEEGRDQAGWDVPDPAVLTFAVGTLCTAVDVWYREEGRLSPEEIADIYADFISKGLR